MQHIRRRIVMLGAAGSGKTSMMVYFIKREFNPHQEPTIGATRSLQSIELSDGTTLTAELWDTAGQERFHSLAPVYYRQAHGAILVFDITSRDSFESAKNWYDEVRDEGPPGLKFILAGNKLDLVDRRAIPSKEATDWAEQHGMEYVETSAKEGRGVVDLFLRLGEVLKQSNLLEGEERGEDVTISEPVDNPCYC